MLSNYKYKFVQSDYYILPFLIIYQIKIKEKQFSPLKYWTWLYFRMEVLPFPTLESYKWKSNSKEEAQHFGM